jgi:transglutaminase-like putative cysteine protease
MKLIPQSPHMHEYLREDEVIDYTHPDVQAVIHQLSPSAAAPEIEEVRRAYEFVRDVIHHSLDIQSTQVTCTASAVLRAGTGLCYAKSHLLAALLRAQGIPTGFCYQRLAQGDPPAMGHALHGLNAVYLASLARWIRLDARGNKPGVQAEFSIERARLAFVVRPALDEIDYPTIYAQPHPTVLKALREHTNCLDLCQHFLPDQL